jgi:hypothetical protein
LRPAAVVEHLGGLPFRQLRDMAHHRWIVEIEFGVETPEAIGPGRNRQIVERGKILDVDP